MTNSHRGPGKYYRQGLNLIELMQKFPDEQSATKWIESIRWHDGKRECPACGSSKSYEVKAAKPMPYRCLKCKKVLLCEDWNDLCKVSYTLAEVGNRNLSGYYKSQGRIKHEAA